MEIATSGIRATIETLCSSAYAGRRPGSRAGEATRAFLVSAFEQASVAPAGEDGYLQPIPAIHGANVLGRIAGRGPQADRLIILAAHHDVWSSPDDPTSYRGADDNAAALAVVLVCAEMLVRRAQELDRSILVCAFDAEEPPYFLTPGMGSQFFVDHPTVPLSSIDMMVCLDLVGHALGGSALSAEVRESVFVLGAERSEKTGALLEALPPVPGLRVRRLDNYLIPPLSDYDAFARREIPFLFYTCGRWAHYHRPTDTPEKLDYQKQAALVEHLAEFLLAFSRRPEPRVRFLPEGFDHLATLRTLVDVARHLSDLDPGLESIVGWLADLQELVETGAHLGRDERHRLVTLVGQLERALG